MPPLTTPPPARSSVAKLALYSLVAALLTVLGAALWSLTAQSQKTLSARPPLPDSPLLGVPEDYAGSSACFACHEKEHESWAHSYHASMTRVPDEETLLAPWRTRELTLGSQRYELEATSDGYFVTLPAPDLYANRARRGLSIPDDLPMERLQIVLLTGSHHYEAYWVRGSRGNELWQVPFVYHFASKRFLPRESVFLQPPGDPPSVPRWNSNCIQCHAVAGQPKHSVDDDQFRSTAAEHGIACEACHGPGAAHVALRQQSESEPTRDPIVDLRDLTAERSADVCGQCHAYYVPKHEDVWWDTGFTEAYTPGDGLDDSRLLLSLDLVGDDEFPRLDTTLTSIFHADGTMRVGGRELNAMRASECYRQGTGDRRLSCLSCHQLHGGTRDDQLSPQGARNSQCAACHEPQRFDSRGHTRHAQSSEGSRCVSCHMPMTSYALLKGIRSHRIAVPSSRTDPDGLNACLLCHQDQPLAFADRYSRSARTSQPDPTPDILQGRSALALALLSGDAAQRALAAFHLGRNTSRPEAAISTVDWRALLLTQALDDPYAAVRFIAERSLRAMPGLASFQYDFIAPASTRMAQLTRLTRLVQQLVAPPDSLQQAYATFRLSSGRPDIDAIQAALARRDETPIRIAE